MKFTAILFLWLFPLSTIAQFDCDASIGFMIVNQEGHILLVDRNTYQVQQNSEVDRTLFSLGGMFTAYHPLMKNKFPPAEFSFGIQTGLGFYYARRKESEELAYQPDVSANFFSKSFGTLVIPALATVRFGKLAHLSEEDETGLSLGIGASLIYLRIADEKGLAILPAISANLLFKRKSGFRFVYHPLRYRSVYQTNAGEIDRLTSQFNMLEYTLRF